MRLVSFGLLSILFMALATPAGAQPAWWNETKARCGLPSNAVYNQWVEDGMPCNSGSSSSSGNSVTDDLMMSMAGSFGATFANSFRNGMEAAQQARARAAAERQRLQALEREQAIAAQEARAAANSAEMRRNQALLASLQGVNSSELAPERIQVSPPLQLRTTDEVLRESAALDTRTRQGVERPGEPAVPDSASLERAESRLLSARASAREAAAIVDEQTRRRDFAARLRAEADANAQRRRTEQTNPPPGAVAASDDQLAEAERLLAEATNIEGQANADLERAQQAALDAERTASQAQQDRDRIAQSLAPATPPQ